nr:DUF6122 family protein [Stenotrophomonas sp. ISL-67]
MAQAVPVGLGAVAAGLDHRPGHLLADPVYAPNRCSIGFHPLHTVPAIALYAGLCVPKKTRLFGIGLLIHIVLDAIDCWWMHSSR